MEKELISTHLPSSAFKFLDFSLKCPQTQGLKTIFAPVKWSFS